MNSHKLEQFLQDHPNVEYVELIVVDPSGIARGKWAPVSMLKKAFAEGVNFPLSIHGLDVWGNEVSSTGLHISSGDLDGFFQAVPDSLSAVPWGSSAGQALASEKSVATTAQVILQASTPQGEPFGACSRRVLERALELFKSAELTPVVAFELEFHLFPASETSDLSTPPEPSAGLTNSDAQHMYSLDALSAYAEVFADIRRAASWADLPVDTIVKEAAPGQYEVNLTHRDDALRAADDVILLKRIVCECARAHGLMASFMAKPFSDQPGNGMHIHASILNGNGENIFSGDEGTVRQHHAVSGLLDAMACSTLVLINTVNGFRRMAPGSYAPTRTNWGENNRSVAVRLPVAPDHSKRIEHRVAGADANPYLVLSVLLHGLLKGLEAEQNPPPMLHGNAYDRTTPNRGAPLPASLRDALNEFEGNDFIRQSLGEQMAHVFACLKEAEIATFEIDITPLERETYL